MEGGGRPDCPTYAHPRAVGLEHVGRQVRPLRLLRIELIGERLRGNGRRVVVRQLGDLFRRQGKPADDLCEERIEPLAVVVGLARQPVGDEPKITLEYRPLRRVVDQRLTFIAEEFLQYGRSAVGCFSFQQVLGIAPQQRLQTVFPVASAVKPGADKESSVDAVPHVYPILMVNRLG